MEDVVEVIKGVTYNILSLDESDRLYCSKYPTVFLECLERWS